MNASIPVIADPKVTRHILNAFHLRASKRLGQNFDMHYLGPDYYQRSLGTLFVYGRNINLQMVEEGYAFAYDSKDTPAAYKQAEKNARAARRGFWHKGKNQQPINPKIWRRHHL